MATDLLVTQSVEAKMGSIIHICVYVGKMSLLIAECCRHLLKKNFWYINVFFYEKSWFMEIVYIYLMWAKMGRIELFLSGSRR